MGDELVEEQIDVPGKKAKWQKFIDRSGQIMVLRERLPNTDEEKGVHEQYKRQWAKAANDAQRQNIARMGGMKQTIMTPHTLHALEVSIDEFMSFNTRRNRCCNSFNEAHSSSIKMVL